MEKYEESSKALKDSLIYQMSLGARELYHSNVWAWLINKNSRYLYVFFDSIEINSTKVNLDDYEINAEREYQHRDIIIWLDSKNGNDHYYLVIENKLKSLPTREQLEKYTVPSLGDNHNHLIGAVVTGIESTLEAKARTFKLDEGKNVEWKFVSYPQIAERIKEISKDISKDLSLSQERKLSPAQEQQINEYCETIQCFSQILLEALQEDSGLTSRGNEQIIEAELSTVYMKLHAAQFVSRITKERNTLEEGLPKEHNAFHFESNNSIQRDEVCIDCAYTSWVEGCESSFRMGIQIQGNQYRRFADYYQKNGINKTTEELFEKMAECGWLYKSRDGLSNEIGVASQMRKDYCQYKGSEYIFVYQYVNLEEVVKGIAFDDYIARIKVDLDKAKGILNTCALDDFV